MFDERRWQRLISGEDCPLCRELAVPAADEPRLVRTLEQTRIVLQDDAAFRGYCILVLKRHVCELTQLGDGERNSLFREVNAVASAVQAVCRPHKLNYAILGNEVPHLHIHVIPRYSADGWWGRAIWLRPAQERRPLTPPDYQDLRAALAAAISV